MDLIHQKGGQTMHSVIILFNPPGTRKLEESPCLIVTLRRKYNPGTMHHRTMYEMGGSIACDARLIN